MDITTHKLRSMSTPTFRGPFVAGNLPETTPDVPPVPPIDGDGGGVAGGTAIVITPTVHTGSGGGAGRGTATVGSSVPHTGTGGGIGAGVADVSYAPPDPTPGTSCASAAALTDNQLYDYTVPNMTTWWFKLVSVSSGMKYRLLTNWTDGSSGITVFVGSGSCPLPTAVTLVNDTMLCRDWFNPTSGPIWFSVANSSGADRRVLFQFGTGGC